MKGELADDEGGKDRPEVVLGPGVGGTALAGWDDDAAAGRVDAAFSGMKGEEGGG